jgi:hypothetical protein
VRFLRPTHHSLHWVMDMVFRDDDSRVRTGNAPANLAAIRHMAQNLIRARKGRLSVKANLKAAAWDDIHLIGLLIA